MNEREKLSLLIKLASPEEILSWSRGEVTEPETINYRTQRAEKDGLFDEKIFGPEKDYHCFCGKYRKIRYKGIVCDKCGVEVTKAIVRRERMGHIGLASPVTHIWFLRSVPSRLGLVFNLTLSDLEKIIYFSSFIIIKVHKEAKEELEKELAKEYEKKSKSSVSKQEKESFKQNFDETKKELDLVRPGQILSSAEHHSLSLKYGKIFESGIGAEALYNLAKGIDLEKVKNELEKEIETNLVDQDKIQRRLKLFKSLIRAKIRPEWMFLTVLPVIPPDLRPIVQLDEGRHASADVNDLYRRLINRNNRLKYLLEIGAPEIIVRNEKRMLQEAVDALIDNSMRKTQAAAISKAQKRPLRSLADMLKGKQGRFRKNLLGKRVDYSGRSVIVVGPELKFDECGLPKHMCLEIYRPFVISKLIQKGFAYNIKGANRLIEEGKDEVWEVLEDLIKDSYVLLNRAPTLHRLGIQAFKPILIEGKAIRIHPMVCHGFNADFDGDQMAVHLPLSDESQREAKNLIASVNNLTKPGTGEPIVNPQQDIVLGCYWLTNMIEGGKGEGRAFSDFAEAYAAYEKGIVGLQSKIKVRIKNELKETSLGRIIFNQVFPDSFGFINQQVSQKTLSDIVKNIITHYGKETAAEILDKIKTLGFRYATLSGISFSMDDVKVPKEKPEIIEKAKQEAEKIEENYKKELLSFHERFDLLIELWQEASQKINSLVSSSLDPSGSIHFMVNSGARGKWPQVFQMAGLKGLVTNPAGRVIELPAIASYKEGLKVLEYFISTHGARKGTADTALKTAVAGYLTRKLVDAAQSVVVVEKDCGDTEGFLVRRAESENYGRKIKERIFGRFLAKDLADQKGKILFKKGHLISFDDAETIDNSGVGELVIRSPLTCKTQRGVCQTCYGYELGRNILIDLGEAVGIVAAQSIGEPGTQLTMRTFHFGGVASKEDITLGLPQIIEIFETQLPSNPAVVAEEEGEIYDIQENEREIIIKIKLAIKGKKKEDIKEYVVPAKKVILVKKGDKVKPGDRLSVGIVNVKHLFKLAGREETQRYILNEIERIYLSQGAPINEKHIEIIVRQLFSRVEIFDEGETDFNKGDIIEEAELFEENEKAKKLGKKQAKGKKTLLGISKVALSSSGFLSAASFQETAKIFINASLAGKEDKLLGLKENVIIGKLIPAGTGFRKEDIKETSALREEKTELQEAREER